MIKPSLMFVGLLGLAGGASAESLTWNFVSTNLLPQAISSPATFTAAGQDVKVQSFYLDSTWKSATLNQNVFGLGVSSGFIEDPQLDNLGKLEIVRMELPNLAAPYSALLSLAITSDDYTIWGNNSGALPSTARVIDGTILAQGQGSGLADALMTVNFNAGLVDYKYLFFSGKSQSQSQNQILDITSSLSAADGYRIKELSAQVVPIPAALPLFLSALAGLGVMGHRRRAA